MAKERMHPGAALRVIGWSTREFARRVDCDDRTARRWIAGTLAMPEPLLNWLVELVYQKQAMPPAVLEWLELWERFQADNPPPPWRTSVRES